VNVRALPPGYAEWPAPAALRDAVACLWTRVSAENAGRTALVLPDGCADLIWAQGQDAFIAGPGIAAERNPAVTAVSRPRPGLPSALRAAHPRHPRPPAGTNNPNTLLPSILDTFAYSFADDHYPGRG